MVMLWSLLSGLKVMLTTLFYLALLVASLSMLLFFIGFVFMKVGLPWLTTLFYGIASKVLLLTMLSLAGLAVLALVLTIWRELRRYFSRENFALRRILSLHNHQRNLNQRTAQQWRQLHYLNRFKRHQLLIANNRKHLQELFDAVNRELQAVKTQLPSAKYRHLKKALRRCYRQGDVDGILSVRGDMQCR